jgi:hypothetical protein
VTTSDQEHNAGEREEYGALPEECREFVCHLNPADDADGMA